MLSEKFLLTALMATILAGCQAQQQQPKRELPDEQTGWIKFIPSYESVHPQDCCQPTSQTRPTRTQNSNVPAAVPFTSQQRVASLKDFVYGGERNAQLSTSVRKIVPLSWGVVVEPDVVKNYKAKVSWEGNDQWPNVLRKMLAGTGLDASISQVKKEISIKYVNKPLITAKPTKEPVVKKEDATAGKRPLEPVTTTAAPTTGKSPFKPQTTKLKPPAMPVITTAQPKAPELIKPTVPHKLLRNWDIKKGAMLRAAFTELVVKEKCGSGFWQVDWNADGVDYPIDGSLHFSGEFEIFYSELFKLYKNADIPLYVHKWPNCVIEIRR